jgi:hypothetical protein
MKKGLLLFIVLLTLSIYVCSDDIALKLETSPAISYSDNYKFELKITNNSNSDIQYMGDGLKFPMYLLQVWNGYIWKDQIVGWCGNGKEMRILKSQKSVIIIVERPKKDFALRIGLKYKSGLSEKVVWSDKIILKK